MARIRDADEAEPIVRRAVESGVTFFDTADMYAGGMSEEITGRLLGKLFGRREDYVLATKVYYPTGPGPDDRGLSCKHIMAAIDASLRRLGTNYVDLYQIHRFDDETPTEESMAALYEVVRAGKAATSARPACTPGSSPMRSTPRSRTDGRPSARCRTTTTWCTARRNGR